MVNGRGTDKLTDLKPSSGNKKKVFIQLMSRKAALKFTVLKVNIPQGTF